MVIKSCSACGALLTCGPGSEPSGARCWCQAYPAIMPMNSRKDCLCPGCLGQAVARRIEQWRREGRPLREMLQIAAQYRKTDGQTDSLLEHVDYTLEQGNYVFTAWYHLKRGKCCQHGCRHCPYGRGSTEEAATWAATRQQEDNEKT